MSFGWNVMFQRNKFSLQELSGMSKENNPVYFEWTKWKKFFYRWMFPTRRGVRGVEATREKYQDRLKSNIFS